MQLWGVFGCDPGWRQDAAPRGSCAVLARRSAEHCVVYFWCDAGWRHDASVQQSWQEAAPHATACELCGWMAGARAYRQP
eukprot:6850154-Prymnesium_polylepis.2